jgi:hypothetical protein
MVQTSLFVTDDRTYYYIQRQHTKVPQSPIVVVELILLTFYLAMLGFFVCIFALRAVFPWMIRLGDYATHDAGILGRVAAIIGVLGIWMACVAWVIALPLIPVIGGVIARRSS